jgi:glutaminase
VGILKDDPRIKVMLEKFEEYDARLDFEEFVDCIQGHTHIIEQAVAQKFVLPEFQNFKDDVKKIFEECRKNTSGANASYIPELAKANPNDWGVSVCTIDGQRLNLGDTDFPFSVQSTSKPISYAIALENHGPDKVHQHVGHEPSGVSFNAITLNPKGLPHNPLINAGAIMVCSLIKQDMAESERFSYVTNFWSRLSGGK